MMGKLGILVGAGVGYVLGTRDGRERYEQIRSQTQRVWKDPRVQEKKQQAADVAKQKGGELQDKASEKASERSSEKSSTSGGSASASTPSTTPSSAGSAGAAGSAAPAAPTTPTTPMPSAPSSGPSTSGQQHG